MMVERQCRCELILVSLYICHCWWMSVHMQYHGQTRLNGRLHVRWMVLSKQNLVLVLNRRLQCLLLFTVSSADRFVRFHMSYSVTSTTNINIHCRTLFVKFWIVSLRSSIAFSDEHVVGHVLQQEAAFAKRSNSFKKTQHSPANWRSSVISLREHWDWDKHEMTRMGLKIIYLKTWAGSRHWQIPRKWQRADVDAWQRWRKTADCNSHIISRSRQD